MIIVIVKTKLHAKKVRKIQNKNTKMLLNEAHCIESALRCSTPGGHQVLVPKQLWSLQNPSNHTHTFSFTKYQVRAFFPLKSLWCYQQNSFPVTIVLVVLLKIISLFSLYLPSKIHNFAQISFKCCFSTLLSRYGRFWLQKDQLNTKLKALRWQFTNQWVSSSIIYLQSKGFPQTTNL